MTINRTHRLLIRMRPVLRFVKTRILHINDEPERIARGIAVGLFTAWLPLLGLHTILSLIFSTIMRANKAMALLFIWVSNPLTAFFVYYPCYLLGRAILGLFHEEPTIRPEQMESLFEHALSVKRIFWEFFTVDLWKQMWDVFVQMGLELMIGGVLLGLIIARIGYWVSLKFIKRLRARRQRRRSRLVR